MAKKIVILPARLAVILKVAESDADREIAGLGTTTIQQRKSIYSSHIKYQIKQALEGFKGDELKQFKKELADSEIHILQD